MRSRARWRRGCLRRRSYAQGLGRTFERDVHVRILGEVPGHALATPLHLLRLGVPLRAVHDVVDDALGEVRQKWVHVRDFAQVANVMGDEVSGVAIEYLDGVAWGFTDGHDGLVRITVFMCLCAYFCVATGVERAAAVAVVGCGTWCRYTPGTGQLPTRKGKPTSTGTRC